VQSITRLNSDGFIANFYKKFIDSRFDSRCVDRFGDRCDDRFGDSCEEWRCDDISLFMARTF